MQLIATQEFFYDGKTRKIGDAFDAPELHGKMFIESKRARARHDDVKAYETAALKKEEKETPHNPRGRYKNRMLRAEQ